MIKSANIREIRRLREDFELQASKYPDLALTRYFTANKLAAPKVELKHPNHVISLWQYMGTFTEKNAKELVSLIQPTKYGLPVAALSAFAVIHGSETELFKRMASRAGSLISHRSDVELITALRHQFASSDPSGKPVFVCNSNSLAVWINFVLFCIAKFQSRRLEQFTLPVDPFAASLAAFDHVLDPMDKSMPVPAGIASLETTPGFIYDGGQAASNVRAGTPRTSRDPGGTDDSSSSSLRSSTSDETEIDFAIITAIEVERRAVCAALNFGDNHRVRRGSRVYWRGQVGLKTGEAYDVVVAQSSDMANVDSALLTNDALHHWRPAAALLVGIAASTDPSVKLGDVVVGSEVYYYERGKETAEGRKPEPKIISADATLWSNVCAVAEWPCEVAAERPDEHEAKPTLHYGIIASGEKVIASSAVRSQITAGHRKIVALDMEGYGFSRAVWQNSEHVRHLDIRGICDEASESKDDRWHRYAANAAASFVRHFLLDRPLPPRKSSPLRIREDATQETIVSTEQLEPNVITALMSAHGAVALADALLTRLDADGRGTDADAVARLLGKGGLTPENASARYVAQPSAHPRQDRYRQGRSYRISDVDAEEVIADEHSTEIIAAALVLRLRADGHATLANAVAATIDTTPKT